MRALIIAIIFMITSPLCWSQNDAWEQQLDGWLDGVYQPYFFLGGSFYTRISFADIDADGDLDLFYGGGDAGSLVYFTNIGDVYNPVFELTYEEFPGLTNTVGNGFGGTVDVDFADLDNDGDLDVGYSGDLDGGGSIFWNDGSPEIPNFIYREPFGPRAGASSVKFVDIDNDGDYDYFSGHGSYPHQLIFAENYGTPEEPYFRYQGDTHNYQDLFFSRPFNFDMGDIDSDGDADLIVCKPHGPVAYYENTGTPDSAYFTLITDNFLPGRDTTDWLESPELVDIDSDGDLDLFLAGGYAHLIYFENTGTPDIFNYVQRYDTLYFFVQPRSFGSNLGNSVDIDNDGDDDIAPGYDLFLNESIGSDISFTKYENILPFPEGCFVDMDADGDYDYLAPQGSYSVILYDNIGDRNWPEYYEGYSLFPPDGRIESPFTLGTGDLDNDEDYDVIIGHLNSDDIEYYRNDGSPEEWEFTYAGPLELENFSYTRFYNVLLDDIDDDNDIDLLIGTVHSDVTAPHKLFYYENTGSPESPTWTYITDDFNGYVSNHRNDSVISCLSDVDDDGDKDLFVTNNLGLQLYLNPRIQTGINDTTIESAEITPTMLSAYPNPSNSVVSFEFQLDSPAVVSLEVYNIMGQLVESLVEDSRLVGNHIYSWDACGFTSGVYFGKLSVTNEEYISKVILIK